MMQAPLASHCLCMLTFLVQAPAFLGLLSEALNMVSSGPLRGEEGETLGTHFPTLTENPVFFHSWPFSSPPQAQSP